MTKTKKEKEKPEVKKPAAAKKKAVHKAAAGPKKARPAATKAARPKKTVAARPAAEHKKEPQAQAAAGVKEHIATVAPQPARPPVHKPAAHEVKPAAAEAVAKQVAAVAPAPPATKPQVRPQVRPQAPAGPVQAATGAAVKPPEIQSPAAQVKPVAEEKPAAAQLRDLELALPITVKDLSIRLQEKPSNLIKSLMAIGCMAGINQVLEESVVAKVCLKYGCRIKKALDQEETAMLLHQEEDHPDSLKPRAPIVTFMGHVDHGKTSLLDAIRKTKVAELEHGGITQHIGAYKVVTPQGAITFLDTPGHEAFTAMRARGAGITDIVVLVVAADDGLMPQTQEAIDHARAAKVPIIVALNKIDKPQANIDQVKKQLSKVDLLAEDWGGKTITVPVSAKTAMGIDNLLEMILLEAQMLELKANPSRAAKGVIVEAKMSKGRGPVATLLIQNGTLHLNENILVGSLYGKVRAMFDDHGRAVTAAGPASPVEVLGLSGVPQAGEQFFVIEDERQVRDLAQLRQEKERQQQMKAVKRISLEDLHAQIQEGKLKELKLILKADVQGSLEAIKDTLGKLNVSEIKLDFIHDGVGAINTSDVILAVASNALILGFNVDADERAKEMAAKEGVDIKTYNIIYELANEIKAAVEGMLEPKLKRVFQGRAEIRKVFRLSRAGSIAGCFVSKGKITRSALVNVIRNGEVVFEGKLSSLKRFKDDVRDVSEGFECGLAVGGFEDYQEGDIVETFEIEKIARKLE